MERLEVALDVDGVLAHFAQHVIDRVNTHTGTAHTYEDISTWEIFDCIGQGNKELQDKIYDELRNQGGALGLPVFAGAKEGVARLREVADVFIVTSPFRPSDHWMPEREKWLYEHFEVKGTDVVHCSKKWRIFADVLVDDKVETIARWRDIHPDKLALLWDAPYNRKDDLPRVRSWGELYAQVSEFRP